MKFSDQDKAALAKLDDFTISADGESATVAGDMQVVITRVEDRFQLKFRFPGGEDFDVKIARAQLLEQLNIGDDESRKANGPGDRRHRAPAAATLRRMRTD